MSVGAVNKQTGDRIPTAGMPAVDSVLSSTSTNPVQNKVVKAAFDGIKDGQSIDSFADVETALAGKADLTDLAPEFSTATAYTVGQYVSYDGNIYKCTSAHSAGAWAAGDFTLVAVGSELESKQDTLTFDNAPTNGSNNPVKSNGIYDSEKDIYAAMGEMGAKNLIRYPYVSSSNSYFQINADGSITLKGANTSDQWLRVSDFYLKPGVYIMTASPSGNAYGVTIGIGSLNEQDEYTSIASTTYPNFSVSFMINEGTRVRVRLYRGENLDFTNNVVLYPMIRLASDTDDTYQPYAKTNKQLTDDVTLLDSKKTDTDMVAADFNAGTSYTAGNYCIYDGKFYKFKNNHSGAWSASDVDEIKIAGELASLKSGLNDVNSKITGLSCTAVANENETYTPQYDGFYIFGNVTAASTFALLYLQASTQYTVSAQGFGISDPASGQAKTLYKITPAVGA